MCARPRFSAGVSHPGGDAVNGHEQRVDDARFRVRAVAAEELDLKHVERVDVRVAQGDRVAEGHVRREQRAAALRRDDGPGRDLVRGEELEAERDSLATQRDDAQARGDAGKKRGFDAQLAENEARISAAKDRIERAVVRSPIAGVVSRGDLDLFVGAKIDPGQPLLEVAGAELHAMVQVPERDARRVRIGQQGTLATRALPDERLRVEVLRVNPAAEVVEQHNVYLAEVTVQAGAPSAPSPEAAVDHSWLRPGMTGTVRLDAGRTPPLIRILRPVVDELRMRLWW